jgi:hypothetical protein
MQYDAAASGGGSVRGAANFFRRTPPVHLLNLRPTHPPADFFFFWFFFVRFRAFLGKGSSKTPYKYSKTFLPYEKKSTKISLSAFPRLFLFIAVSGVSQRWDFKNTTKTFCKKNRVEKFLQKI